MKPSQPSLFDNESDNVIQAKPATGLRRAAAPRSAAPPAFRDWDTLRAELAVFSEFGAASLQTKTVARSFSGEQVSVPTYVNEFWTSVQRAASSLHEVSYRACFKPQLPRFFIERLTRPGDKVYDPFMGRGTTPIEAALLGRIPLGCDVNPLSARLVRPRVHPPTLSQIQARLSEIDFSKHGPLWEELLVFYHPETLKALTALKEYLLHRIQMGHFDAVDDWIGMVALNRLTGHSPGFFSVYTLPPNQAASISRQAKINQKRSQVPPQRDVVAIILKKSRQLLGECDGAVRATLAAVAPSAQWVTSVCSSTPQIRSDSIRLVVTSPPFLDVVQYAADNWLRCWFLGIDPKSIQITMARRVDVWQGVMTEVFRELARVLEPGGAIAFEVGEVNKGAVKLEEAVLPCGLAAGLIPELVLINAQEFTKTARCWGVDNNSKGTNSNRIVVFSKPSRG